jgi:hypothetical protein
MPGAMLSDGARANSAGWSPGRQRPSSAANTSSTFKAENPGEGQHWAANYKEEGNAIVKFGGSTKGGLGVGGSGIGEKADRSGSAGGYQGVGNGPYLMRGGFRMPKKDFTAVMAATSASWDNNNSNFPSLKQQQQQVGGGSTLPARPGTAPSRR